MKLQKWALIAEIAGTVAIVATLIVLIWEVRSSREVTLAGNRQSLATRVEELVALPTRPEIASVLAKAAQNMPLDDIESHIFSAWYVARLRNAEEAFLQFRDGNLDEEYWLTRLIPNVENTRLPGAHEIWSQGKGIFVPDFVDAFDEALVEAGIR